jgi:disulfide bond formation protein DsbB
MKTATSLALVAIGAIFAFAITRSPSFLNLQVVGWVLMLTGAIGAVIPRRGYGWLRRSMVVKNEDQAAETEAAPPQQRFSRWLVPGGLMSTRGRGLQPTGQVERETIDEYIEE